MDSKAPTAGLARQAPPAYKRGATPVFWGAAFSTTMLHLDLTLDTPAENLALDEALWEAAEAGSSTQAVLRFWESPIHFVVLGYANRIESEVNLEACRERGLAVLRRITGGGAVLQGPGCLNYTLVLPIADAGPTASIPATNLHIMNRHATALTQVLGRPVRRRGDTDLAIGDSKFSGNAQRRGRRALVFHGTFLLDLDVKLVQTTLRAPTREPAYRQHREHTEFMLNLGVAGALVKAAIQQAWEDLTAEAGAGRTLELARLLPRTKELAAAKYDTREWNWRF